MESKGGWGIQESHSEKHSFLTLTFNYTCFQRGKGMGLEEIGCPWQDLPACLNALTHL